MAKTFKDVMLEILAALGVGVFKEPSSFVNALRDHCDDRSPEYSILSRNSDDYIFAPLAKAAAQGDRASISDAVALMEQRLIKERFIDSAIAHSICSDIASAVIEYVETEERPDIGAETSSSHNEKSKLGKAAELLRPRRESMTAKDPALDHRRFLLVLGIVLTATVIVSSAVIAIMRGVLAERASRGATLTIRFVGNGETSGAMDNVVVADGATFALPECAFEKESCHFEYWRDPKTGKSLKPNDKVKIWEDTIYVAIWSEPNYLDKVRVSRFDSYADAQLARVFLVVENDGQETIDIGSTFKFLNDEDERIGNGGQTYCEVPSGQLVVLTSSLKPKGSQVCASTFYNPYAFKPATEGRYQYLSVEELSCSDKALVVQVTNTSSVPVLPHMVAYGASDEGYNYAERTHKGEATDVVLQPGESWKCRIKYRGSTTPYSYANKPWNRLERYLFAYGDVQDEQAG